MPNSKKNEMHVAGISPILIGPSSHDSAIAEEALGHILVDEVGRCPAG